MPPKLISSLLLLVSHYALTFGSPTLNNTYVIVGSFPENGLQMNKSKLSPTDLDSLGLWTSWSEWSVCGPETNCERSRWRSCESLKEILNYTEMHNLSFPHMNAAGLNFCNVSMVKTNETQFKLCLENVICMKEVRYLGYSLSKLKNKILPEGLELSELVLYMGAFVAFLVLIIVTVTLVVYICVNCKSLKLGPDTSNFGRKKTADEESKTETVRSGTRNGFVGVQMPKLFVNEKEETPPYDMPRINPIFEPPIDRTKLMPSQQLMQMSFHGVRNLKSPMNQYEIATGSSNTPVYARVRHPSMELNKNLPIKRDPEKRLLAQANQSLKSRVEFEDQPQDKKKRTSLSPVYLKRPPLRIDDFSLVNGESKVDENVVRYPRIVKQAGTPQSSQTFYRTMR
ncbi:hypothetical protein Ciccas_002280 [Cichlidogyrus casuarinus]|uniref:Uncharacterized protein n=1 Tax=Cichlidogyrus casuarinus TaxID=1844966 RepID=A0ABD2QHL9_9PLAT